MRRSEYATCPHCGHNYKLIVKIGAGVEVCYFPKHKRTNWRAPNPNASKVTCPGSGKPCPEETKP